MRLTTKERQLTIDLREPITSAELLKISKLKEVENIEVISPKLFLTLDRYKGISI